MRQLRVVCTALPSGQRVVKLCLGEIVVVATDAELGTRTCWPHNGVGQALVEVIPVAGSAGQEGSYDLTPAQVNRVIRAAERAAYCEYVPGTCHSQSLA